MASVIFFTISALLTLNCFDAALDSSWFSTKCKSPVPYFVLTSFLVLIVAVVYEDETKNDKKWQYSLPMSVSSTFCLLRLFSHIDQTKLPIPDYVAYALCLFYAFMDFFVPLSYDFESWDLQKPKTLPPIALAVITLSSFSLLFCFLGVILWPSTIGMLRFGAPSPHSAMFFATNISAILTFILLKLFVVSSTASSLNSLILFFFGGLNIWLSGCKLMHTKEKLQVSFLESISVDDHITSFFASVRMKWTQNKILSDTLVTKSGRDVGGPRHETLLFCKLNLLSSPCRGPLATTALGIEILLEELEHGRMTVSAAIEVLKDIRGISIIQLPWILLYTP